MNSYCASLLGKLSQVCLFVDKLNDCVIHRPEACHVHVRHQQLNSLVRIILWQSTCVGGLGPTMSG